MRIILTKTNDAVHDLEVVRDDGTSSRALKLESKVFLIHDLSHYVVEGCAGLDGGVWGALAAGKSWDDLNDRTGQKVKDYGPTMATIEGVVGPLSNALRGRTDPAKALDGIARMFEAHGGKPPEWLTPEFVTEATDRLRRIVGQWNSLPYRGAMELRWPMTRTAKKE
jgi:hypothetical protein